MANLHQHQIARAERGVIRSQKANGRRRGSGGCGLAAVHGPASGTEIVSGRSGALGLAAKAPSASADRALAAKFLGAILALGAIAAIVAAAIAAYGH